MKGLSVLVGTETTDRPLGHPLRCDDRTLPSAPLKLMEVCQDLPIMLFKYPLIPSMGSHLGWYMAACYCCCRPGPHYHLLHLDFACGGNRKHFIMVVCLAQVFPLIYGTLGCQHVTWYWAVTLPVLEWWQSCLVIWVAGVNLTNDLSCQRWIPPLDARPLCCCGWQT